MDQPTGQLTTEASDLHARVEKVLSRHPSFDPMKAKEKSA